MIFKKIEKEAIKIEFVKRKKERKKWKERSRKKEKDRSRGLFLIKDRIGKERSRGLFLVCDTCSAVCVH